jgi:uncharacterized protein
VPKAELVIPLGVAVDESVQAKALDESLQFRLRNRSLQQVHPVRADAPLGKEALRLTCIGALLHPEDLYFHALGRFASQLVRQMNVAGEYRYQPAWWLPGPHAQTIWGRIARRRSRIRTSVECLSTSDGDGVELHHVHAERGAPRVLLLHGLEGSVRSHYVGGVLGEAQSRGWGATLLIFRGCGSTANTARRFYHSGETSDVALVFAALSARWPESTWMLAGVSLGGNVLLKWLGELGVAADPRIKAAAVVSVPFDLEAGARCISRGFARLYDRSFLRSLRRKALAKLARYPDLFDRVALERARNVYEFDDAVTAPVHGFASAHDYYEQSSSVRFLPALRVRTLLLSASDDPFLPPHVLSRVAEIARSNTRLVVEFQTSGGHVGFVGGARPWSPTYYAEKRVFGFFDEVMEQDRGKRYDRDSPSKRK